MITRIRGRIAHVGNDHVTLAIEAFDYQVLIPEFVRRQLQGQLEQNVVLHTIQYLEGNMKQGNLTPRLIGFLSEVEREFFELFTSVDGVGVRKALRAMVRPVREVAEAIEQQDAKLLSTLPGIGAPTAERIIAKLRRKVPKFALMVTHEQAATADVKHDVVEEAYEFLQAVGHSSADARKLLNAALETKKNFKDVQALLAAVYEQSQGS